ncbi:MAG: hypoxanthine phosphoribosyltransferase [Dehalococcoidia bacterium]|nr:hypoxanthine phosphoribosyltransferase [Dehalococcoidia bacterium]
MPTKLKILISYENIAEAIDRLAAEITRDYKGKRPLLVGILKGSFMFMADLVRHIHTPLEIDFVKLSSYGSGTESSGKIKALTRLSARVKGRHVIVIEDIVDTGLTTGFLMEYLRKKKPASLRLCALTVKPSRHKVPVSIDYLGFTVPDKFIVGYGIDWNEKYRYLPDICYIE